MIRALMVLALTLPAAAQEQGFDDSDLAGRPAPLEAPRLQAEGTWKGGVFVFPIRRNGPAVRSSPMPPSLRGVFGTLELVDPKGRVLPARGAKVLVIGQGFVAEGETDAKGEWFVPVAQGAAAGPAVVRFRLENRRWSIVEPSRGRPYEWEGGAVTLPAEGVYPAGQFRFDPEKSSGKIGFIQLQFLEAQDLFARAGVSLGWWKKQLKANYPGSADFFSPWAFSLDLTRPETWDVNLHELGHAVMAAGTRSFGGGGPHKIDECYNEGLAWSEGFATFFAGAVRLARGDEDARFEYLVPRRAPIRIENVPDDVCKGDASEWRVSAGLWDLYDTHKDGADEAAAAFGRLWKAIEGKRMGGFSDAWADIQGALLPEELAAAEAALRQNTLLPAAAVPVAGMRMPLPKPPGSEPLPERLGAPDFDGSLKR